MISDSSHLIIGLCSSFHSNTYCTSSSGTTGDFKHRYKYYNAVSVHTKIYLQFLLKIIIIEVRLQNTRTLLWFTNILYSSLSLLDDIINHILVHTILSLPKSICVPFTPNFSSPLKAGEMSGISCQLKSSVAQQTAILCRPS